ncbi:BCCT family transporter [Ornithinimicrobium humiphilum]|uniref:Choline/glycine/proline betaine transport protein n=1 Tax=Ornithinimicrobium humiphilum TaxID=125288 RepID=A0A543KLG5_9MICO|nr:BCCT family transporter [Ornithinimicrobium humiphilum]TQM95929.1 choline/glycine/proline betaine transport protein [Ornithinimicrobium humiphilum]
MSAPPSAPDRPDTDAGPLAGILRPVFLPASVVILALLAGTIIFSRVAGETLDEATARVNEVVTDSVGWWYVIAVNIFLAFTIYCAVSRVGRIRLGRDDERPEFGVVSWFLMLFSAGMGIGLVFFGVAEPLSHYVLPPEAFGNEPESLGAAQDSVGLLMLQWGLHPWAIYAVVGLGLAYMSFRRGRPLAVRWLLEPLLGRKRVEGWIGHAIDTVAIVGTLFGVATSFGFGVSQILGGLEHLGWAESSPLLIIGLITGITLIAVWSVVTGVHKGLKWLSNTNMSIAALLALTVFVLGPTVFLLQAFPENLGSYLVQLPETAFHVGRYSSDGWEAAWTIAYWGWWTSWAPFVGMFIARISRGRTIREFVLGVLLAPTLVSLLWFTVFGDSAILFQQEQGSLATPDPETGDLTVDSTTALFQFFESMPGGLTTVLSVIAIVVVILFFVTSSDSGSLVIDMLASGGSTSTSPVTRTYWAVLEGAAAAVLLVAGGDVALTALQTLSVSTAAPFSVILVLGCLSLLKAFRHEVATMPLYVQVLESTPQGVPADAAQVPVAAPGAVPAARRRWWEELRGVSTTLDGLPVPPEAEGGDGPTPRIVNLRRLRQDEVHVDPETGAVEVEPRTEDPLAGEVFDTPEFEASQEFVDQQAESGEASGPAAATDSSSEEAERR